MSPRCVPKSKPAACSRSVSEIDAHVGDRMRARREQLGMSDDALALALGISCRTLGSYETGTVRPTPAKLSAIATVLAVPISYFFDGREEPSDQT
jgi:transcriptional regulator with XRE-family HTH domain